MILLLVCEQVHGCQARDGPTPACEVRLIAVSGPNRTLAKDRQASAMPPY